MKSRVLGNPTVAAAGCWRMLRVGHEQKQLPGLSASGQLKQTPQNAKKAITERHSSPHVRVPSAHLRTHGKKMQANQRLEFWQRHAQELWNHALRAELPDRQVQRLAHAMLALL